MPATPVSAPTCATCGEFLHAQHECLACLVRAGLEEPGDDGKELDSLVYGDFEIARRPDGSLWELGRGAMGVTYQALDRVLQRSVALKVIVLPVDKPAATAARERFLREARAAAALRHPHVAGVFQIGVHPTVNRCFYAMELVRGETLEALVRREGPIAPKLALEIAIQLTQAMIAAAAEGLIHRDLKPANIMLASDLHNPAELAVKVIDFGLAKSLTARPGERDMSHGGFVGTPTFASPEQLSGAAVDARSDLYSLGVTLWYALTGELPCPGRTIEEIRHEQEHAPLPIKQLVERKVPAPLVQLLRRTLATDAGQRPGSATVLLAELERCRAAIGAAPRRRAWAITAGFIALLFAGLTSYLWLRPTAAPRATSIAVLPFSNLSADESNTFFAEGVQDDVLTSLAQIRKLKVISRTSVMSYRASAAHDTRQIGRALGVENLLEGSVRREGNRILLNVQLIDARHDRQIWAHRYDRTAADFIGLQGELATQIAAELRAKLTPAVASRFAARPTGNAEAYTLYLKGLGQERTLNTSLETEKNAERFYLQAIALDDSFALAHARLSIVESFLRTSNGDRENKASARGEAERAIALAPTLGEAHMAMGLWLYWGKENYDAALKEFSIAADTLPNEPDILHYVAGIERRQGHWQQSLATYDHALEIDPRNPHTINYAAIDHLLVRDWPAARELFQRALAIAPDSIPARLGLAYLEVYQHGDPATGRTWLAQIHSQTAPPEVSEANWDLAMLQRDFAAAEKILADFPLKSFPRADDFPKGYYEGQIARARGDMPAARQLLERIRPVVESWRYTEPENRENETYLAFFYAYLGRREDGVRAAHRAIAEVPESQNAYHGASRVGDLALVYALTGEKSKAIDLLERLLQTPGAVGPFSQDSITLAELRLRWEWDTLRSEPRFQKLLAGPEPRTSFH